MNMGNGLYVDGLNVAFARGETAVVRNVSFSLEPGQSYGLVGESGSGKTMTARAIVGLLPPGANASGRIVFGNRALHDMSRRDMEHLRGSQIGMIFQDPTASLNPLLRVGPAIAQ